MTRRWCFAVVIGAAVMGVAAAVAGQVASPSRRASEWNTAEIFRKATVRAGAAIADVGSGDGFLTIPLAEAVGSSGRVFAVDVNERVLADLKRRVQRLGLENVDVIRGTERDPRLAPDSLDAAIVLRAYHEFDHHQEMLARIRDALRPGGRLVIADVGPRTRGGQDERQDQVRRHVLASAIVQRDLAEAGFRVLETLDPFVRLDNGERAWLISAERPPGRD